jgi:hypothetical protein
MDQSSTRPRTKPGFELIERPAVSGWDVWPELVRTVGRLRSPIMEHRVPEPLPPDPDRVMLALPAARDVLHPMAWATLIALPVLIIVGWQAAIAIGATGAFIRVVDGLVARSDVSFAGGFLGYRAELERPRGVQEDDELRWNWSRAQPGQGA